MTEMTILKMEARKLLDEVNQCSDRLSNEARILPGIMTLKIFLKNIQRSFHLNKG